MDVNDNYKHLSDAQVEVVTQNISVLSTHVSEVVEEETEKKIVSETEPSVSFNCTNEGKDILIQEEPVETVLEKEKNDLISVTENQMKSDEEMKDENSLETVTQLEKTGEVIILEMAPEVAMTEPTEVVETPPFHLEFSEDYEDLIETDFEMLGTVLSPVTQELGENIEEHIEEFLKKPEIEPAKIISQEEDEDDDLLREVPSPAENSTNSSIDGEDSKKKSFVDSLLDKIRGKNSEEPEILKFQKILSESDGDNDNLLVEIEAPVRYSKSSNPNQLATPIVRHPRINSAFVNTDEEYQMSVAKHKLKKHFINEEDKTQMGLNSEPPKMQAPEMPLNVQRPRTLAEKRQLIGNNNEKFLIVEQESKIYRQVQRKKSQMEINYNLLDAMLYEDIPVYPGPWKVLTWLRTREGNFIHQYINLNGCNYRLNGSCGNHSHKFFPLQSSMPFPKHQSSLVSSSKCCIGGRIKKRYFDSLLIMPAIRRFVLKETVDPFKKLETKYLNNQLVTIKPRPLSKKIEYINMNRKLLNCDEDSAFLGDYLKYEMPNIILETKVQTKTPLAPTVKQYLKEILPHRDMSENWCNFALTALTTKEETQADIKNTFEFIIPYQDNKRNILAREIIRAKEDTELLRIPYSIDDDEDVEDEMDWTFSKNTDKNDPVECDIVDIIKDLTNSVFINLNDDLFTQDEPSRKDSSAVSSVKSKEAIQELSTLVKPDKSKKILSELRRLNANVFVSESPCVDDVSCNFKLFFLKYF